MAIDMGYALAIASVADDGRTGTLEAVRLPAPIARDFLMDLPHPEDWKEKQAKFQ